MKDYDMNEFMNIIRKLRSDEGCPWDREQTHESLKNNLIEECYETVEAINNRDSNNLCEELGDILLQIALHTVIAEENEHFTIEDVINGISRKMIYRHPHVFGSASLSNTSDVLNKWEELKRIEKDETAVESICHIPKALPSVIRAEKVQKKASKIGYDFLDRGEVFDKVLEELTELRNAVQEGDLEQINEEFGDVMFTFINLSRFLRLNAENSLTNATDKFINRLVDVERIAFEQGKHLEELSIDELNALWGQVK